MTRHSPPPCSEGSYSYGCTVSVSVFVTPFTLAEIVRRVEETTTVVFTVKVCSMAPAGTEVVAGTVASGPSEDRCTVKPPVGAAPVIFTWPVAGLPPVTVSGVIVRDDGRGAIR